MSKKIAFGTSPDRWNLGLMPVEGFAPLVMEWKPFSEQNRRWDALVDIRADGGTASFAMRYQRNETPREVAFAAMQIAAHAQHERLLPLLVVPYLSHERLLALEQTTISAMDLCGNGVVRAPGQFHVFRTGYPNRFTSSRPLKNVYRGVSSLVGRALLLKPQYGEIRELQEEIVRRGGEISLATLSKALTELEADVILQRTPQPDKPQARALRLLQPEKLLSRLEANYTPPKITQTFVGKVALPLDSARLALQEKMQSTGVRMIATGVGSASRYATLAMESTLYLYTSSID